MKAEADVELEIDNKIVACLDSPQWECRLFGAGDSLVLHPLKVPNKFWRWMQFIVFGNRWVKINQATK